MPNLPPFTDEVHDFVYALKDQINCPEFEKQFTKFIQDFLVDNPDGKSPSVKDMADALDLPVEIADILTSFWTLIPDSGFTSAKPKVTLQ
ncbi:MAG: hypothetical protein JKY82_05570 [Rhizobiaceae bacterium]|nr:hypothetical protein [Rhizobiaceae bacterium]